MFFIPPIYYEIFLLLVSQLLLYCCAAAADNILPNNDDDGNLLLLNPPAPTPILNQNGSMMVEDNDLQLQCRGGPQELDYTACRDALHTFPRRDSALEMEVGRRGGMGRYAFGVPWKWVSGKSRP